MNELELCRKEIDAIDKEMARLYEERMKIVSRVAKYKIQNGMPVLDKKREAEIIDRRTGEMENQDLAFYYRSFLEGVMKSSRAFQGDLIANQSKRPVLLSVSHDSGEYPIVLGKGLLPHAGEYFPLDRKVLVLEQVNEIFLQESLDTVSHTVECVDNSLLLCKKRTSDNAGKSGVNSRSRSAGLTYDSISV